MTSPTRLLFETMWREEWRLHAELFGGGRFATFPLVVVVLTAAGGVGLTLTGTDPATVETGIRGLTLLFGLYAGTAAFVGRDAAADLLGDVSLVLSTSGTLPVDPRRALGVFLVKDAIFYAAVFLLPLAVGTAPLGPWGEEGLDGAVGVVGYVAANWAATTVLFSLGMAVTVILVSAGTRDVSRLTLGAVTAALVGLAWWAGVWDALVAAPSVSALIAGFAAALLLGGVAVRVYDPTAAAPSRSSTARIGGVADRIPGDDRGLVAASLLALARSSGGVVKPLASAGLLLLVVVGLVAIVESIVGVRPAPGVFFGSVLGLSAFTTYNWLTATDALANYRILPVDVPSVFAAKRSAFGIVGLPAAATAYVVALVAFPTSVGDAALGALLLLATSTYVFGLTVFLAGFEPNEFLFDPARFGLFGAGVAVAVVPAVIGSFLPAAGEASATAALGGVGGALVLGVVGVVLGRRAESRWERLVRDA